MGRPAQPSFTSRVCCGLLAFSWLGVASAQVPVQAPTPPADGPPQSDPPAAPATQAAPALPPPPAAPPPASVAPPSPPPLDPPPSQPPSTGPSFLERREAVEAPREPRPARPEQDPRRLDLAALPRDFALDASPWVDFTLTNFWIDERASNFLNLGVQIGGYFKKRLRVTARLVAPLEEPQDDYRDYGYSSSSPYSYENSRSPSVSLLYGASLGLIISNSRSFVFGPGLLLMRTDVNDYGTAVSVSLPFEWTTKRRLRVGFELAIGHAFGGEASDGAGGQLERPGGTSLFLQYQMGFSMGHL